MAVNSMNTPKVLVNGTLTDWDKHSLCVLLTDPDISDADMLSSTGLDIYTKMRQAGPDLDARKNALTQAVSGYGNAADIIKGIMQQKGLEAPPRPFLPKSNRMHMTELRRLDFPPEKWIAYGLIPVGLTVLGGKSNSRKSWTVLELAFAVAVGKQFWGRQTESGPVLFYALEDSLENVQERCILQRQPADADIQVIVEFSEEERKEVLEAIRSDMSSHRPKLVVIDTLSTLLRATDQNSPEAMTEALSRLQRLAFEFDCAVVVVHHTRKSNSDLDMFGSGDWYDEFRGSTAIVNMADAKLFIASKRGKGETEARFKAGGRKFKDEIDLRLNWNADLCRYDAVGDWFESGFKMSEERIVEALKDMGGRVESRRELAVATGTDTRNISRDLKRLLQEGIVIEEQNGSASKALVLKSQV